LNQGEPDRLADVLNRAQSSAPRRPAKTDTKIQVRRLDRRLSATTVAELVAAYEAGASTPELCTRYKLSKGGVLKLLRQAGVEIRHRGLSDQQVQQAEQLYREGCSYAEIGRRIGKAKSSVREVVLKRHKGTTEGARTKNPSDMSG